MSIALFQCILVWDLVLFQLRKVMWVNHFNLFYFIMLYFFLSLPSYLFTFQYIKTGLQLERFKYTLCLTVTETVNTNA